MYKLCTQTDHQAGKAYYRYRNQFIHRCSISWIISWEPLLIWYHIDLHRTLGSGFGRRIWNAIKSLAVYGLLRHLHDPSYVQASLFSQIPGIGPRELKVSFCITSCLRPFVFMFFIFRHGSSGSVSPHLISLGVALWSILVIYSR